MIFGSVKFSDNPLKYRERSAKNLPAPMKRTAAILFSLAFAYGGVAWALGKCLSYGREHEHPIEAHDHSYSHGSASLHDSRDFFGAVIHCPPVEFRIGPAAQSSSTQLHRLSRVTALDALSFEKPESFAFRNTLWLDAVFRRTLASLYSNDIGRYLLLSILQI
jgi:hypothetical protein